VVTCALDRSSSCCPASMEQVKDTLRATVRVGYDGRVYKTFRGPDARERFAKEVRVLRHLEKKKCNFVPKLLDANAEQLRIVTTNCGVRVEHLDKERAAEIFAELEPYGVRHEDAEVRNITYRQTDGRFCVIDFEFSTILPGYEEPADASSD
jgi:tRNA A-37 threonylcarbamoyl transferase component Bud32